MTAPPSFGTRAASVALALAWIAFYVVVGAALGWVLLKINPVSPKSPWYEASRVVALAVAFCGATWVVGVRVLEQSWTHWGWRGRRSLANDFPAGVGLGALLAALAVGLAFVTNRASVRLTGDWGAYWDALGPLAVFLLGAALFEELMFRGLPLQRLADAVGPRAAVAAVAVVFAAAHVANPHASALGMINIALAAVLLSFGFFSPGGIMFAWGLHFGWNAGLGLLFDAPVSGQRMLVPAVEYAPGRHGWVDGGTFGPEGGLVATIVLIAGITAVLGRRVTQPRRWLL